MQARIKFTKFGANSVFGGFAPGDRMRVDASLANHLVEQGVAVSDEPAATPAPAVEATPSVESVTAEAKPARAKKGAK